MDFFEQQDIARRKSYFLVFLFVISLSILVILSNIVVSLFLSYLLTNSFSSFYIYWNIKVFLIISVPLISILFILTHAKLKEFRDTDNILHDYFNASLIKKYKATQKEKVLLNIVEELSIASGLTPLNTYAIEDYSINSFVIGNNYEDASLVVTSNSLEKLSREELQAMVAHEFAKIFTNDMNLNINLTAITYSLLSISKLGKSIYTAYEYSKKEADRNRDTSIIHYLVWFCMILISIFLFLFGLIGYCLANLIKLLIIRQRMFLIDSLSIEYIRNPIALINVLKISSLHQSYGSYHDLFEHAYFAYEDNGFFSKFFNIYPNIKDRIDRLNQSGTYNLDIKKEENIEVKKNTKKEEIKDKLFSKENIAQAVTGIAMFDNFSKVKSYGKIISTKKESLPEFIHNLLDDLESTKALIISLLLSSDEKHKKEQIGLIKDDTLKKLVLQNYKQIKDLKGKYNLLIYFYSINILKQLDIDSYRRYRSLLNKIIYLDDVLDIFEWNIENILVRQLDIYFSLRPKREEKYFSYEDLQYSLEIFLSVVSYSQESKDIKASKCFDLAVEIQDMYSLNFIEKKDISNKLLKQAIEDLEYCSLELRKNILQACVICICIDNIVENWEIELIYSISILLGIPLPFFEILKNKTFL